ncbi:hypothetical protein MPDQ_001948 [Monascus purpureus]|uniref:Phosphoglycerate mutase n=1 Tax=Monascus purpureus TaxID=5098 RepID=A0A507QLH4_MONPU|nr:hypothetical protein MPDQ_001948 [Monascus purpureus]BDD60119.1 hypothetical protein MAP00_005281 [Monascus purpureus]
MTVIPETDSIITPDSKPESEPRFTFTTVPGYFLPDLEETDPGKFDYDSTNFGLIDRTYPSDKDFDPITLPQTTQWERFEHHVRKLNADAKVSSPPVSYKVLFLARHGEGYHNVAERYYGREAWDSYWSLQPGNDKWTWFDAKLTPTGTDQALTARKAWKKHLETNRIPAPESYYVSPLMRCLQTARLTFEGIGVAGTKPFTPVVKENIRETLGMHTCDARSPKSVIEAAYPTYVFEEGFSDADPDPFFDPARRESNSERNARVRGALVDIFSRDENVFVSVTVHSGVITSFLEVIGHRPFQVMTGGVVAVLVKGERIGVDKAIL